MPEYGREQEPEGQRSAPTRSSSVESPAVGKSIETEPSHGAHVATPVEGRYKPTFDPHNVKVPWSNAAKPKTAHSKRGPSMALDGGEIHVAVVNLRTGDPRDKISGYVTRMAVAWSGLVDRFSEGVLSAVHTLDNAAFKKAPAGLIGAVWGRFEGLLTRAAGFVTGGTMGATLGLAAIRKVLANADQLEAARLQGAKQAFIGKLKDNVRELQAREFADGSTGDIDKIANELEDEFTAIGKTSGEDEWKKGESGVVGPQAAFLKELEKRTSRYAASVPTSDDYVREFLAEWVTANVDRKTPALRSPFKSSRVDDGFISVDLTLTPGSLGGPWGLSYQDEARLHCPGSAVVAAELTRTRGLQTFDELGIPIHLRITPTEPAWEKLPPIAKRERTQELHFDAAGRLTNASMKMYWSWLTSQSRWTSLNEIFQSIRVLKG